MGDPDLAKRRQGDRIGYVRVSSVDQHEDRQVEELTQAGCDPQLLVVEKASAARNAPRPQLDGLLASGRPGDTVVVSSWDRLARSVDDLNRIVDDLNDKGLSVESIKEGQTFTAGERDPRDVLVRTVMAAFAEFEREVIRERQREGIAAAKKRGVYSGGKTKLTKDKVDYLKARRAMGVPKAKLARELGVSRPTVTAALEPTYIPRDAKAS